MKHSLHADKTAKNKSRDVATETSKRRNSPASAVRVIDNRAEAVALRKLQETIGRSVRVTGLTALQETIAGSPRVKRAAQWQATAFQRSGPVVQRLKKGDFKELAVLGLDVGTWIEFADAVKTIGVHGLTMASRMLELRSDMNLDTIRAKLLIDKQKYELRKPPHSRILDLFKDSEPRADLQPVVDKTREQEIVVGDNVAETVRIRTASDLLIWLVSHPAGSALAPVSYAEPSTMIAVLNKLWKQNRMIEPPEVWGAVREVVDENNKDDESAEEDDREDEPDVGPDWPQGHWDKKEDEFSGVEFPEPARFRRKMSPKRYDEALAALDKRLSGYKLVGLHATRIESTATLVSEGVSKARFDTGHHLGKGKGFYVVPTSGALNESVRETALSWGSHFVGVYLPSGVKSILASEGQNVQTLEEVHAGKNVYYLFGAMEAVIPPSLCDKVLLVTNPADISVADPQLEAEPDPRGPFDFVDDLPKKS
jgi:hypothetical protein